MTTSDDIQLWKIVIGCCSASAILVTLVTIFIIHKQTKPCKQKSENTWNCKMIETLTFSVMITILIAFIIRTVQMIHEGIFGLNPNSRESNHYVSQHAVAIIIASFLIAILLQLRLQKAFENSVYELNKGLKIFFIILDCLKFADGCAYTLHIIITQTPITFLIAIFGLLLMIDFVTIIIIFNKNLLHLTMSLSDFNDNPTSALSVTSTTNANTSTSISTSTNNNNNTTPRTSTRTSSSKSSLGDSENNKKDITIDEYDCVINNININMASAFENDPDHVHLNFAQTIVNQKFDTQNSTLTVSGSTSTINYDDHDQKTANYSNTASASKNEDSQHRTGTNDDEKPKKIKMGKKKEKGKAHKNSNTDNTDTSVNTGKLDERINSKSRKQFSNDQLFFLEAIVKEAVLFTFYTALNIIYTTVAVCVAIFGTMTWLTIARIVQIIVFQCGVIVLWQSYSWAGKQYSFCCFYCHSQWQSICYLIAKFHIQSNKIKNHG